ncbi:hypothetical protein CDL12_15783 [Handroanthus impetiginosus]|uniref:Uncharacterized protein n=1 Tax=Handroanthus impetiginosus TaxID=429701 RepID=A0A2G9H281_9LAMI|nr:hypothetical protein CDL12_15783 [Handroanthus impetiginosus]
MDVKQKVTYYRFPSFLIYVTFLFVPCSMLSNGCKTEEFQDDVDRSILMDLQAAQAKFDNMKQRKSNIVLENDKLRESIELVKTKMTDFKPELRKMDGKSLEEELKVLLSDKAGETEYLQSLQVQITRLKEISHKVMCSCGAEYIVILDL